MARIERKRPTSVARTGSAAPPARRGCFGTLELGDGLLAGVGALGARGVRLDALGAQPLHFFKTVLFDVGIFCGHADFSLICISKKQPRAGRARAGLIIKPQDYSTLITRMVKEPSGASTVTTSPALWLSKARPSGDSCEMRPSRGLASAGPTMV